MTPSEWIAAGELNRAIDALSETLRRSPHDMTARVSLFTLLCLSGHWDRAAKQLETWESLGNPAFVGLDPARYRLLFEAERARQRYFADGSPPRTFTPQGAAVTLTISVVGLIVAGRAGEARRLVDQFDDERPPRRGRLGECPFDDFRDADDVMAPVLEVLAPEGYFWVGWDEVQFLDVVPPRSLLDLLWAPARLGLSAGVIGAVALPGLYPGTCRHPDELVRLGRRNDWIDLGAGLFQGAGPKVFAVGGESKALLELQDLFFDAPGPTSAAPSESQP
jgi:type VI secretion system protein ImpE